MGLDLLEITLKLEKELRISVSSEDWNALSERRDRGQWDITVGDVLEMVCAKRADPAQHRCEHCRYDLRGHPEVGRCPECNHPFDFTPDSELCWSVVQTVLARVFHTKPERIRKEMWLVRDLKMS